MAYPNPSNETFNYLGIELRELTWGDHIEDMADVEKGPEANITGNHAHYLNSTVNSFAWEGINVTVKDRKTKQRLQILRDVSGTVNAGEFVALMGPSGSGKTTLLNVLADRAVTGGAEVKGSRYVNGAKPALHEFRKISRYVQQEEALLGALTVRETLDFAAKLSLPSSMSKKDRVERIDELLQAFGLRNQADTFVGTPLRKGISGGQKRRVSVATQLITSPKLLFLDEPTSGLDSTAAWEVMSYVRSVAKDFKLLVIASIHQPSTMTFELFDKLILLSSGRTVYLGPIRNVTSYFDHLGYRNPPYMNPAEYLIGAVNGDFTTEEQCQDERLEFLQARWSSSIEASHIAQEIAATHATPSGPLIDTEQGTPKKLLVPATLTHRAFIKSYRDVVAYGIRIAMYMGLAILMGTVWLRLSTTQENIQNFTNAIFFGGAFMSFMAVAYIPAFLEDRALYAVERANGLYGPAAFVLANFLTGLPYLFLIALLFSTVSYWLGNFRPTASAFWTWLLYLFLDLVAAESLVVLLSSLVPIFVVALAATAFANGLWMSVGGFLVAPRQLNVFWRYWAHYIDYQAYVFQGMMVNEFAGRNYSCARTAQGACHCMYQTRLAGECLIDGRGVLEAYGYKEGRMGKWVGILCAIILGYRLLGWLVLYLRRT